MITLDKWADQLAGDMNRPFDHILIHRLKDLINQEYATILKQKIDKDPMDESLLRSVIIPVEYVPDNALERSTGTRIYKTKFKLSNPIRSNKHRDFKFVGSSDGVIPFIRNTMSNWSFFTDLPLVGNASRYNYDEYITVISDTRIKFIKVTDLFADLQVCYNETIIESPLGTTKSIIVTYRTDVELDVPLDIINLVKYKLLNEELKLDTTIKTENAHVDNN
jgi:hypothetical protein